MSLLTSKEVDSALKYLDGWIFSKNKITTPKFIKYVFTKNSLINNLEFPSKARWPLDISAPFLKGPGLKI